MCYDISFSTTIDVITDYLPDIIIDGHLELDVDTAMHVIAQSYMKYPIILFEDAHY